MNYKKPHYLTGKKWTNAPKSAAPRQWLLLYDWCHYCKVDGEDFSEGRGAWEWVMACGTGAGAFRWGKAKRKEDAMLAAEEAYLDAEMSK